MIPALLLAACLVPQEADEADKKAAEAVRVFQDAFKSPDPLVRAAAVRKLSKVRHEKCLGVLSKLLILDDLLVRKEAALGLADYREPAELRERAATALLGAVNANLKNDLVLEALFVGLGAVGTDATLPGLHRLFEHKRTPAAVGAVKAAGDLRRKESIEPLIQLWKALYRNRPPEDSRGQAPGSGYDQSADRERYDQMRGPTVDALASITGQSFEKPADAEKWWRENKATFEVKERKKGE